MELQKEGEVLPPPKKKGKRPGQRPRTGLEIARDRAEITKLRLRYRMSPGDISAKINEFYKDELPDENTGKLPPSVGIDQVYKELQISKDEHQKTLYSTIQEKRHELIRLWEDLANQVQERYEESCKPKLVVIKESRDKDGETTTIEREVNENTDGNPMYLSIKDRCLLRIAELEGAFMPRKTALTNPDGTEAFKFEGSEEVKRLEALMKDLLPPGK